MTDNHSPIPAWNSPWPRRRFLQGGTAVTAAALGLLPDVSLAQGVPNQFDGTKFQLAAAEPNPKRGGVLRVAFTSRQPHFDIHQSGTFNNLGTQACMFDNLVRRDPRDGGKTIIPDLAHSWDIAEDGKTYTFILRKDVQFHDGAELTAEDVKATFDRIVKPPAGISIPRSVLFKSVDEIVTPDKYTVTFKLSEPRPVNFIMSSIASGWNVIVRKKTLEDNAYNLRRLVTYPGTGPFKSVRRVENEVWVVERNPGYWNKPLPYLDGIEFFHALPFSPEMGSAILSNRVDYVRATDPGTMRRAKATPGMTGADYYQSVIYGTYMNNKKKPFDDVRVRRALHLVIDKPILVDVIKEVAPHMVGGFIYPFSEFATSLCRKASSGHRQRFARPLRRLRRRPRRQRRQRCRARRRPEMNLHSAAASRSGRDQKLEANCRFCLQVMAALIRLPPDSIGGFQARADPGDGPRVAAHFDVKKPLAFRTLRNW